MNISVQTKPDFDLTTIKVNLKYPTNYFDLYTWDFCPYSLKTKLALEYKLIYYKELEYIVSQIFPYSFSVLKRMKAKTGYSSVPQLKFNYKQGVEETWINDSTKILKFLDSLFPEQSLFFSYDLSLNLEISLWEDWIDEAFKLPYFRLLYLNKNNLLKANQAWTKDQDSVVNKIYLEMFKKSRINDCLGLIPSEKQALNEAQRRFDEDLLPLVCDRLESMNQAGYKFLLGNNLSAADLSLYAFLKSLLSLEESSLVHRRPILQKYLEEITNIPLDKISSNFKQNTADRHKLVLLERQDPQMPVKEQA